MNFFWLLRLLFLVCIVSQINLVAGVEIPAHQTIAFYETQKQVDHILFLMQKRLAIMHEVARIKWNQNLPIEDLPREQQLLVQLTKQGQAHGMDGEWIYTFFQAQFDAAKMIQHNDFAIWSAQEKETFEAVLDLKQEIRPYLDQISIEMIEALAKLKTEMKENHVSPFILPTVLSNRTCDYINNKIWQAAIFPLKNLEKSF